MGNACLNSSSCGVSASSPGNPRRMSAFSGAAHIMAGERRVVEQVSRHPPSLSFPLRKRGAKHPAHDGIAPEEHPQFRDHRAYRPRQVDARRPPHPDDRRAFGARDEGAGARYHGHRARARHHHQGPDRPAQLPRQRRRRLCPQPDRHARPCRFRLRSQPLARRLRGLAARRRREPGGRGADPRQCLPGDRQQPRDRAGPQQGRPPRRRARAGQAADRGRDRARRLRRARNFGQDRPGRRRRARGDRHAPAAARGRPRGAAEGAPRRFLVRRLSRRGRARPDRRWRAQEGHEASG